MQQHVEHVLGMSLCLVLSVRKSLPSLREKYVHAHFCTFQF